LCSQFDASGKGIEMVNITGQRGKKWGNRINKKREEMKI
jgi:hypothetical protein